jgi:aspartate aminotransferase
MREGIQDINLSIRKISEKARENDSIRLDIGQPSFDTPQHVKDAAKEGLSQKQGYTSMKGIDSLRQAVAEEESMKEGIEFDKEDIIITTGGMGALYGVFAAELDSNGKAVFNDPCWGPYKMLSEVNDNQWSQVRYFDEKGLREEAKDEIEDAELVVVTSPDNPTGRMLDRSEAKAIAEFADENDTLFVSDEVYHCLTFGKEHVSPAQYNDDAVIIGSVSKNHAMTGWRIGSIAAKHDIDNYAKVNRAMSASPNKIGQIAAVEAIENRQHVEKMRSSYEERAELVKERMDELGWDYPSLDGAIYAFPEVGRDSWSFCLEMVEKGVAMVPGEPFGPESSQNVRIAFGAATKQELNEAFDILEEELK